MSPFLGALGSFAALNVPDEPNQMRGPYTLRVPGCGDLRHKKLECSPFLLRSSLCLPLTAGRGRLPRYRNTGKVRPRRDRLAHPSALSCPRTAAGEFEKRTSFGGRQPPRQRREELLPAPIRDSVTLDNCPSAVEPLSFVSLLDGHRQLAGCGQEGDARIRPVRFRKCPDRTPTAHSLSCRLRPGLRTTRT